MGGNVTSHGNAAVTERGIVYATSNNPTTSNTKLAIGTGTGSFTSNVTGLTSGTTYYVRAYATNSIGTEYGSQVSFTTTIQKVIPNCPMYPWNDLAYCGPITVGNLFAYWDLQGYDDMFPGDLSHATKDKITEWMSSTEHYNDYFLPKDNFPPYTIMPDKSEPPIGDEHLDNCIADFLGTGFSRFKCPGGLTLPIGLKPGIDNYVKHFAPKYKSECKEYPFDNFPWDSLVSNIDRNHPMVALVNMNNDNNFYDHWTLVIGYKDNGTQKYFGCVSLQGQLKWFPYTKIYEDVKVSQWRIFLIYTFNIQKLSSQTSVYKPVMDDQFQNFPNPYFGDFYFGGFGDTSKMFAYTLDGRIIQKIINPNRSSYFRCSISRNGIYYLRA